MLLLHFGFLKSQCNPVFRYMLQQPPSPPDSSYNMKLGTGTASPGNNSPILYCVQSKIIDFGIHCQLIFHIWNGSQWISLKETRVGAEYNKFEITMWGNRIIGWGKIRRIDNLIAPSGKYFAAIEYKNGQWDTLAGGTFEDKQAYKRLEFYSTKNDLYFSYEDPLIKQNSKGYMYKYNTSNSKFEKIADLKGGFFFVCAGKNKLLITSALSINGRSIKTFAYIEGDSIKLPYDSVSPQAFNYFIDKTNDHVYSMNFLMDKDSTYIEELLEHGKITRNTSHGLKLKRGGTSWPFVSNGIIYGQRDIENVEWASILCPNQHRWIQLHPIKEKWMVYNISETGIYIYDNDNNKVMELISGSSIKGRAYFDTDSNCILNNYSDPYFANQFISASSDNFKTTVMTDDSGNYELFVADDSIILKTSGIFSNCFDTSLFIEADTICNISHKLPLFYDLKATLLSGFNARWNSVTYYKAIVENNGPPVDSAYFEFKFDSKLKVLATQNPGITFINDSMAGGQIKNLTYYEKRMVYVEVWIDSAKTKPDSVVCNRFSAYPYKNDSNPLNNTDSVFQRVVYSLDPNYKDCNILEIPELTSSRIEYFIGFQNEGNDDAYDVVIIDTLSPQLIADSVRILQASHPYTMSLVGQVLTITFSNIYLKPKNQDEANSQGSIKFAIYTKNNLVKGDFISNKAYIYFDLNPPVITDAAIVRVPKDPGSNITTLKNGYGFSAYPNPAGSKIQIKTEMDLSLNIYSVKGELLFSGSTSNGYLEIDISLFPAGLFLIRCGTNSSYFIKLDE